MAVKPLVSPPRDVPSPRVADMIVAIIPARGGSKGIHRKNIVDLCGKPLIAYAIEAALKTPRIARVILTTDDPGIAAVGRRYGAETPFLRPPELAQDASSLVHVHAHALAELKKAGCFPTAMVSLLPTSPFRNPRLINLAVDALEEGYNRVITVKPVAFHADAFFLHTPGQPLKPFFGPQASHDRVCTAYRPYGLLTAQAFGPDQPLGDYVITLDREYSGAFLIDIDAPEDLRMAEEIIRQGSFNFDEQ